VDEKINRRSRSREKGRKREERGVKRKRIKTETQTKITNLHVVRLRNLTLEYPVFFSVYYTTYCLKGKR